MEMYSTGRLKAAAYMGRCEREEGYGQERKEGAVNTGADRCWDRRLRGCVSGLL